ncbi:MAG TPA: HigA family addiction module antitoxin [Acidobacteriaceae bacterium]|nr:HigA family addiction module antitoxin [Acidobacteriaceae bacterium]HUB00555.1 HigA family addiction module antitoxin [Terracidiphilus sp.]
MSERIENQYIPDIVSPPGETLEEVLSERGMSQAELAERMGRPKKTINEIVKGKAAITAETAIQFERVLGVPASFWMVREQNYREALARAKEFESLESQADWLKSIPYRAMAKLGWVEAHKDRSLQIEALLRFFGVASPSTWEGMWSAAAPSFRLSPSYRSERGAISAWLRKGELDAGSLHCRDFDERAFKAALSEIRSLTRNFDRGVALTVQNICAASGVAVVFVPEIPGTSVWGATRWLSPNRALIQLSLRYKTDDHLWFTFFHEAGHILLHGKRDVFVEEDQQHKDDKEAEADTFSRDWLIPASQYRAFCRRGAFSCAAVSRFAHELGIAPGIVVGRLQHDSHLSPAHCHELKKKVDWIFATQSGESNV